MPDNYQRQQQFLDYIKSIYINYKDFQVNRSSIYSLLISFDVINGYVRDLFPVWKDMFLGNDNINIFTSQKMESFLFFTNKKVKGNEIKLYIPLDINHIRDGVRIIFDYMSRENITHESKVNEKIRNDNVVIRVNTLEDADKVIFFVKNNPYLMEGLLPLNPFLPQYQGIGIAMDNYSSYNGEVAQTISDYLNYLISVNRLDLFTVEGLKEYIYCISERTHDADLKDKYITMSKVMTHNFDFDDYVNFLRDKSIDRYKNKKRIIDPKYYFERAVINTDNIHPQNTRGAIMQYLHGNANYFTRKNNAYRGLIKYVHPRDVISIMRSKLVNSGYEIPRNDNELINIYIELLNKDRFEIIKDAYLATMLKYNKKQADIALLSFIKTGETILFSNDFSSREKLEDFVLGGDVVSLITHNINVEGIEINSVEDLVEVFGDQIDIYKSVKK